MKKRPVCPRINSTKFPHEFLSIDFAKPHCLLVLRGRNASGRSVLTEQISENPTFTGTKKERVSVNLILRSHNDIYVTLRSMTDKIKMNCVTYKSQSVLYNIKSVRQQE